MDDPFNNPFRGLSQAEKEAEIARRRAKRSRDEKGKSLRDRWSDAQRVAEAARLKAEIDAQIERRRLSERHPSQTEKLFPAIQPSADPYDKTTPPPTIKENA